MNKMILVLVMGIAGLTLLWARKGTEPPEQQKFTFEKTGSIFHLEDAEEKSVSHNPSIKKRTIINNRIVPHLVFMNRAVFKPGDSAPAHNHEDMDEIFYVESGVGSFIINGKNNTVSKGGVVYVTTSDVHEVTNNGDVDLVLVYYGIRP